MIKETITYPDLEGQSVTEELYFHLTQLEAAELALELSGEEDDDSEISQETIAEIMHKRGRKGIMEFVKLLVLKSYGIKGADNRSFVKNEKITTAFSNSLAYSSFVVELLSDDEKAAKFINSVIPANYSETQAATE